MIENHNIYIILINIIIGKRCHCIFKCVSCASSLKLRTCVILEMTSIPIVPYLSLLRSAHVFLL